MYFFSEICKNSAAARKKRYIFFKSTKAGFTVSIYVTVSEESKITYKYIFNTIKSVFVDLKKTLFFFSCGTIFSMILTQKCTEKNFSKNETELQIQYFDFAHIDFGVAEL